MKQKVHLGQTESGRYGFFTNGYLAMPLTDEEFAVLSESSALAKAKAEQLGFELEITN